MKYFIVLLLLPFIVGCVYISKFGPEDNVQSQELEHSDFDKAMGYKNDTEYVDPNDLEGFVFIPTTNTPPKDKHTGKYDRSHRRKYLKSEDKSEE